MTDLEIRSFIEKLEEFGDIWTFEDVKRVYGNTTFEDALSSRMSELNTFGNIIDTILNR